MDTDFVLRRIDRTFAFIDLSGFTAFNEKAGDEQAVDVLVQFRNAVRNIASKRGVRIAKWLGEVGCYRLCLRESGYQFYKFIRDNKENVRCRIARS